MKPKTKWQKLSFELTEMENKAAELYYTNRDYKDRNAYTIQMQTIVHTIRHIRVMMDRFEKESHNAYLQRKMPKV